MFKFKYEEAAPDSGSGGGEAAPAPEASGIVESVASDTAPKSWLESLPDDIRQDPSLQNFKDSGPSGLAKSWVHAQKTMGKDRIILPGEGATDDDWSNIYSKLGRPESADKYDFKLPEGKEIDKEFTGNFKQAAFDAGLSGKQVSKLAEWYHGAAESAQAQAAAKQDAELVAALDTYKHNVGGEEKYKANVQRAQIATRALLNEDQKVLLQKTGMDKHPAMIELFASLTGMMSEDKIRDGTGVAHGENIDTINQQIEALEAKIFSDMASPNKDAWVQQRAKLYDRKMAASQQM